MVPRGVPAQRRALNWSAKPDSRAERSAERRGPRGGGTRPWAGPWARGRGPAPASGRGRRGRRVHLAVVQRERQQVGRGCAAAHGRPLDALHGGARSSAGPGRTRAEYAQDSSGRACDRALRMPGARGAGRRGAAPSREGGPSAQVAPAPVPVQVGGSRPRGAPGAAQGVSRAGGSPSGPRDREGSAECAAGRDGHNWRGRSER